ncbi:MAG: type II secretion system protein GspN [Candidatus Dadabacteria bacterium]|nr:MAG: type II secretion system protein GspN [Candidatus Dadabacteria bacterium]
MTERLLEWLRTAGAWLRRVRWGRVARTGGVGLVLILLSLWVSLPVDSLLEYATREAANEGLRIEFAAAGNGLAGPWVEGIDVAAPVRLHVERLSLRPRLQTLWGDPGLSFSARLGLGTVDGNAAMAMPADLHVEIDQVRLGDTGLTSSLPLGMRLDGTLSGIIDGVVSPDPDEITGTVNLTVEQPVLAVGALPLPVSAITGSKLKIKAEARSGEVEIAPVALDGGQVWGTVRGTVKLQKPAARSRANLTARIHFNDELGNAIGPLLPMAGFRQERDAWVRQYKGPIAQLARSR